MTEKSDDRVEHLNTIFARGGGNLNDPIFKSSNARVCPGWMMKFRFDRRITYTNKIGFLDFLFDAVQCFSGFSSENMRLYDLNRVHVFSDFACSFRF